MDLKDIEESIYYRAQHYIRLRERTEKEISDYIKRKLEKYNFTPTTIDEILHKIIQKLIDDELIDDNRFVNWWVQQRNYFKPRGIFLLKQELQNKGVQKDTINHYFEDNPIKELDLAKEALHKKSKTLFGFSGKEQEKKALDYLLRRGFSYTIAKKAFEDWSEKL
ncbi:MAG TPA: regulatory protein RecX [Candidatus Nitrosocosmicus sp.]|nr:regulatory protein RecX [Candidatus Nitrosocosmicus sp.]